MCKWQHTESNIMQAECAHERFAENGVEKYVVSTKLQQKHVNCYNFSVFSASNRETRSEQQRDAKGERSEPCAMHKKERREEGGGEERRKKGRGGERRVARREARNLPRHKVRAQRAAERRKGRAQRALCNAV